MVTFLLVATLCVLAPAMAGAAHPMTVRFPGRQWSPLVAIQPLGHVDPALIRKLAAHLRSTFAVRVTVLPPRGLPGSAYHPPRNRYRGERILADLDARTPGNVSKVLGVMTPDLGVTKSDAHDWGVAGVALRSQRPAVVSTRRLGRRGTPPALLFTRLTRVASHELGHVFGATHCASPGCLMNDAHGSIRVVDRSGGFCSACRRRLRAVLTRA